MTTGNPTSSLPSQRYLNKSQKVDGGHFTVPTGFTGTARVLRSCLMTSQADEFIQSQHEDKEYLPITGLAKFNQEAIKLAYGADSAPLKEGRVRR